MIGPDTDASTTQPPRRRRRFALSLRALMLLILLLGGALGWQARRASLQRRAAARIERLGGSIEYDWQYKNGKANPSTASTGPNVPAWLRKAVGDEYFQDITKITLPNMGFPNGPKFSWDEFDLRSRAMDEDQLACLEGLERLESLELRTLTFNADGLDRLGRLASLKHFHSWQPLAPDTLDRLGRLSGLEELFIDAPSSDQFSLSFLDHLPRLRVLFLGDFAITDEDLLRVSRRNQLEYLSLGGRKEGITDAGLAHLSKLDRLKSLNLRSAAKITDAGLAHLKGLKSLNNLNLTAATGITDAGLAHLAGLAKLETLELRAASKITDAGLAHLAGLTELKILWLRANPVTDAGLAHLRGLIKLQSLHISGDNISDRALNELRAANPALRIDLDRPQLDDPGVSEP